MFSIPQSYQQLHSNLLSSAAKIFRPWDASGANQDATISTTTHDQEPEPALEIDVERVDDSAASLKIKPEVTSEQQQQPISVAAHAQYDPYYSLSQYHPDFMMQTSAAQLAQSLGADPYLLDSLGASGGADFALEEYARVISQDRQTKLLNAARKQRPKKYKCPHCGVGFSNNGQLKGHIRIHTGERPFKCDESSCGKTFTRNEELTRHKRIHSGLRPFPCAQCGKRFGRKDHLKKHTRTHMQQPPSGLYALPVMLPLDTWAAAAAAAAAATASGASAVYPYVPMFGY